MAEGDQAGGGACAGEGQRRTLASLEHAVSGSPLVLLCGDPGSGRTTLLRLLGERLAAHGTHVVHLSPDDVGSARWTEALASPAGGRGSRTAVLVDDADALPDAALTTLVDRAPRGKSRPAMTIVLVATREEAPRLRGQAAPAVSPVEVAVSPLAAEDVRAAIGDCLPAAAGEQPLTFSDEAIARIARFGRGNLAVVRGLAAAAAGIAARNRRGAVDGETVAAALIEVWARQSERTAERPQDLGGGTAPASGTATRSALEEQRTGGDELMDRWQRALSSELRRPQPVQPEPTLAAAPAAPAPDDQTRPPEPSSAASAVSTPRPRPSAKPPTGKRRARAMAAVAGVIVVGGAGLLWMSRSAPVPRVLPLTAPPVAEQAPPPARVPEPPKAAAPAREDRPEDTPGQPLNAATAAIAAALPADTALAMRPDPTATFDLPSDPAGRDAATVVPDATRPSVLRPEDPLPFQDLAVPSPATVREVQFRLRALGYKPGPIDGIEGPRTAAAVWAFETESYLPADGLIDDRMLNELRARTPDPGPR